MSEIRPILVTSSWPFGPSESFLDEEIHAIAERLGGLTVVPIRPRGELRLEAIEGPRMINVIGSRLVSWMIISGALRMGARYPRRMISVLKDVFGEPRRLHRNLPSVPKALWLGRVAAQSGTTHIHAYWASVPATVAMIAARVADLPWSMTAHRWDIYDNNMLDVKARSAVAARYISARGQSDAELLGARCDRSRVIHLGVRISDSQSHVARRGGTPTLICPASFIPIKGHPFLLTAFAESEVGDDGVVLELFGTGPEMSRVMQFAQELGIGSHVRFHGQVDRTELLDRYQGDARPIVVLGSQELSASEHEGIPFALIEAMAQGVPVIATSTGSIDELLEGSPGLLVTPDDPAPMAEAMRHLTSSEAAYASAADWCYARVTAEWQLDSTTDAFIASILGGGMVLGE